MPIKSIKARQIFDSRGNPTVEVDLVRITAAFYVSIFNSLYNSFNLYLSTIFMKCQMSDGQVLHYTYDINDIFFNQTFYEIFVSVRLFYIFDKWNVLATA